MKNAQQDYRWTKDGAVSKLAHHLSGAEWHKKNKPLPWNEALSEAEGAEYYQYVWDTKEGWMTSDDWETKNGELPDPPLAPPPPEPQHKRKRKEKEPQQQAWPSQGGPPGRAAPPPPLGDARGKGYGGSSSGDYGGHGGGKGAYAPNLGIQNGELPSLALQPSTYERLNEGEIDFFRSARCLVDAANTIGQAASTSAQVAEAAARGWRAEAHRMDILVRELMYQVEHHQPFQ